MKVNSFEDLANLIANSKKDKKIVAEAKSKSLLPTASERCSIGKSEEKARHKEELKRAKAEYKRSCQVSKICTEVAPIDTPVEKAVSVEHHEETDFVKRALRKIAVEQQEGRREKFKRSIDQELHHAAQTAVSVDEFEKICRKLRDTLDDDPELLLYYDHLKNHLLEEVVDSKPRHVRPRHRIVNASITIGRMSEEERRRRNGDKNRKEGYSTTGVKLPSQKELQLYHEESIRENLGRKPQGKVIIYIPSGGMNKRR